MIWCNLIETLKGMNNDFGKGQITAITLRVHECEGENIYGVVVRDGHDERFFKLENNFVTFLSRRRKLNGNIRNTRKR